MMCISSSSKIISSCCYVVMVLFVMSACAYVIEPDELRNGLSDEQFGFSLPSYYDRFVRTTKFPRIGRSSSDIEGISSLFDANTNINSEENEENNENELRWFEQRSVAFPRIGKRTFHNLLWANSLSNPHGRYHINGYDHHIYQNQPQSITNYRGKRNISM